MAVTDDPERLEVYDTNTSSVGFVSKALSVYRAKPKAAIEVLLFATALPSYFLFYVYGVWQVTLVPIIVFAIILLLSLVGGKKE